MTFIHSQVMADLRKRHAETTDKYAPIISDAVLVTTSELHALIKGAPAGTEYRVTIRNDASMVADDGTPLDSCLRTAITGSVKLAKRDAEWLAKHMLSDHAQRRGARIGLYATLSERRVKAHPERVLYRAVYWFG